MASEVPSLKREAASKRVMHSRVKGRPRSTDSKFQLNDPKWPHMWYLDSMASYDVNSQHSNPQPRYDMIDSNQHGTRCAEEVTATTNNSLCAVGVAYEASIGGVRILDGDVTDAVEARSLSLNPQHGRNGMGSIFIWASGNGGRENGNCNCDGYTNSIWTLSISSATERGELPWYSEMYSARCYNSDAIDEKQVVTTDLHHSCTTGHTGTSASAPLAAGICALALQANKDLTWRDMQHIGFSAFNAWICCGFSWVRIKK